eukprot:gene28163-31263_t
MRHAKWGPVLLAALVACVLASATVNGQSLMPSPPLSSASLRPPPPRVPANIPPRPPAPPLNGNTPCHPGLIQDEDLVIAIAWAFLMDETAPPTPNGVFLRGDCREDTSRFPGGTICDFDASFPTILLIAQRCLSVE